MKNGVRITDTKFNVDTENKVVVCELNCDLQLDKHPAWLAINPSMWEKKFPNIDWKGTFTVKAKARCNDMDTFNEKKGKMIAESRAKLKMYNIAGRLYECCSKALTIANDNCLNTAVACTEAKNVEKKHIEELTK